MQFGYKHLDQKRHRLRPWLLYRLDIDAHCHLKRKGGMLTLINLLNKGILPNNIDFVISAKKILTKEEFNNLTYNGHKSINKQPYINVGIKKTRCLK